MRVPGFEPGISPPQDAVYGDEAQMVEHSLSMREFCLFSAIDLLYRSYIVHILNYGTATIHLGESVDALEPGPGKRKGRELSSLWEVSRKTLIPNDECKANVATV
ncbi:hypothetical protein PsorP6_008458 [Peronosclerospora sorghi]|uniref:Uncharacterized protein n=1 Tax=Peronosclerospora sorghi TaxID=230839 RepID=A0ACC0W8U6_9STRA|nr:hypothetical protein PsorP6_008458 [Peronosclerospora sorghi]